MRYIQAFILYIDKGDSTIFENAGNYSLDGLPMHDIIEVIVSGRNKLISKPELRLQKADYIPALNVGEKSDKYVKHEDIYLSRDNHLYRIKANKKEWINKLDFTKMDIERFLKENKIRTKKRQDLIKLFKYINNLNNED